jgi:hypothetical protein
MAEHISDTEEFTIAPNFVFRGQIVDISIHNAFEDRRLICNTFTINVTY